MAGGMIDSAITLVSSAVNDGSLSSVWRAPAILIRGGAPALMCRSEPSSSASITNSRSMFVVSTREQCTGTLYQLARTNSIHPGHHSDLVPVDAGTIAVAPVGTQELDDPDSDGLELPEDDDATGSGFLAGA